MAYGKVNIDSIEKYETRYNGYLEKAQTYLNKINELASALTKVYDPELCASNKAAEDCGGYYTEGYETTKLKYQRKAENYNAAVDELLSKSSSYSESVSTKGGKISTSFENIKAAIETFEGAEVESLSDIDPDAPKDEGSEVDYSEMSSYDASDRALEDPEQPTDPGGGCGGAGPGQSDWDIDTPDSKPDEGINAIGQDQSDSDTEQDTNPQDGTNGNGQDQSDKDTDEDTNTQGDGTNGNGQDQSDKDTDEDTNTQGDGTNGNGQDQSDKDFGEDDKGDDGSAGIKGQNNTGGSLVETSGNLVGDLVNNENDGLNMEDVASWGAAGVTGLMLGLTNLGKDENGDGGLLSGLAMGMDDDRTLADAGLDVFEHPNYTNGTDGSNVDLMSNEGKWSSYDEAAAAGFGNNVMTEQEFLNAKANGDPTVSGYSSYQDYLNGMYDQYMSSSKVDAFAIQGANELGENGENQTSFAAGFGAMAGAALAGGAVAGGLMAADNANGGMFGDEGAIGPDGRYHDGKKTINDVLFGVIDETDEEEKRKQTLRERIAMIASTSTSLASLVTFGFANAGMIAPIWFTISILMFAIALLYFFMVKDKKNKRREELEAVKKMTSRRGFFGNQVQEAPASKEVDWILFGMILLSTSAFILKTYDVISWLLFIILLILFILIIIAYVILKKKFGENNNGVPY